MKQTLTLFILTLVSVNACGQQVIRTIRTDSSTIKVMLFGYTNRTNEFVYTSKLVYEYLKGKNLVHQISYYADTIAIESEGYTDTTLHHPLGIFKSFDKEGNLKYTIDNSDRRLTYADSSRYPYYRLLSKMQLKADSIIKNIYSDAFFEEHLNFNYGLSCYFDKFCDEHEPSLAIWWLSDDFRNCKPREFKVTYDLFEGTHYYYFAIKMIFDLKGALLESHLSDNSRAIYNTGLEDLGHDSTRNFKLTTDQAIVLARQRGMVETDSTKAWSFIRWEENKDTTSKIFNGHFKIYVLQRAQSEIVKHKKKEHRYERIQHYNVWVFNPWTREFEVKKSMHTTTTGSYYGSMFFHSDYIDD